MQKSSLSISVVFLIVLQITGINCTEKKAPGVIAASDTIPAKFSPITMAPSTTDLPGGMTDFVTASRVVTPAVVHIKTIVQSGASGYDQARSAGGT